jgi:hypothetical protein
MQRSVPKVSTAGKKEKCFCAERVQHKFIEDACNDNRVRTPGVPTATIRSKRSAPKVSTARKKERCFLFPKEYSPNF